ncbi:sugar O-acetyltransferase [Oceanobacillus neutriphilus]|uniref:Acetyltransferase n=1 Tax=Oceanobacillus neutriphilus TaxID=531815 RepID=A0ABQ2NR48_9BACI|nr:sugar O-acetyltransferase [Oceanobacillus neutriphilus]GGP08556.1 maltose O-acetyltransferase [Oceanobacillus neutriphilus]
MSKQYQNLLAGKLYKPDDKIQSMKNKGRYLSRLFNQTTEEENAERKSLIKQLFGSTGEIYTVKPPFYCSHGAHIHVGENFFCNFNCIFLDLNEIHIGSNVAIGPRVSIYTALHPIDQDGRNTSLEYALPVMIEDNVWIAGDVVINPGVTIGEGSIIGSGSVVTRSIPKNVIALGNPCRVHREITEEDKKHWEAMYEEYQDSME